MNSLYQWYSEFVCVKILDSLCAAITTYTPVIKHGKLASNVEFCTGVGTVKCCRINAEKTAGMVIGIPN